MADTMDALKNILGDDAEDKVKSIMNSLSSSSSSDLPAVSGFNTDSLNQVMQLKDIMDSMMNNRDDPRSNLLLSLKPYMRTGRQKSIDSAVKLLGLANMTKMLRM